MYSYSADPKINEDKLRSIKFFNLSMSVCDEKFFVRTKNKCIRILGEVKLSPMVINPQLLLVSGMLICLVPNEGEATCCCGYTGGIPGAPNYHYQYHYCQDLTSIPPVTYTGRYYFYVIGNPIPELGNESFSNVIKQLYYIKVVHSKIETIENATFLGFYRIQRIWITHSLLDTIEPGSFPELGTLTRLYLNNNRLQSLGRGIFNDMVKLTILYVNDNILLNLEPNTFLGLASLTDLHLQNNRIVEIKYGIFNMFKGLFKLSTLKLSNNRIEKIEAGSFTDLRKLLYLHLDNNKLATIDINAFEGLVYLYYLYLENNLLTSLPYSVFNLRDFQLTWGKLTYYSSYVRVHLMGNPMNCNYTLCWIKNGYGYWVYSDNFRCEKPEDLQYPYYQWRSYVGMSSYACNNSEYKLKCYLHIVFIFDLHCFNQNLSDGQD